MEDRWLSVDEIAEYLGGLQGHHQYGGERLSSSVRKGRKAIRLRIGPLFKEVKKKHVSIFRGNEAITLSDRAHRWVAGMRNP